MAFVRLYKDNTDIYSSVVASIIKIVVSFEISSGGLAANVDEDCEFTLYYKRPYTHY